MGGKAARSPAGEPHTPETAVQTLSSVFVQSLRACRVSQAAAARAMRVTKRTVVNYVKGETPVSVAAVMLSPKLWRHFARCLLVTERKARRV